MAVHELLRTEEAGFYREGNSKVMARWGSVPKCAGNTSKNNHAWVE